MRFILKPFAKMLVRYLQKKYRTLSEGCEGDHSNFNLSRLIFIQHTLYFLKNNFQAWGYFHPSCMVSEKENAEYEALFPVKDHKEISIVVHHNPEAVTFYQNIAYDAKKSYSSKSIEEVLRSRGRWT